MTNNVRSLTNRFFDGFSNHLTGMLLVAMVLLGVFTVSVYSANLAENSTSSMDTKNTYSSVKSFGAAYTVTRTYTSKNNVIINNLWKSTHAIGGGLEHACALSNGKVFCWGRSNVGQLGNGTTSNSSSPVLVGGALAGKEVTGITVGGGHSCAIAGGRAYCWGNNSSGRLGNGPNNGTGGASSGTTNQLSPVAVNTSGSSAMGTKTVTAIAAGGYHTCAIADSTAYCWGRAGEGQIGNGSPADPNQGQPASDAYYQPYPTLVNGSTAITTDIVTGSSHTCAIANSLAYCWGGSSNTCQGGRLGNNVGGCSSNVNAPVAVNTGASSALAGKVVTSIAAGSSQSCAIADGRASCWGPNLAGENGTGSPKVSSLIPSFVMTGGSSALPAGAIVYSITTGVYTSTGQYQTCATAEGKAYCWGSNTYGQLGNGTTGTASLYPVAVSSEGVLSGKYVSFVSPGSPFACAVANGRTYCWGLNNYGQLGIGTTTDSNIPIRINDSYY
ncbi:MAG: hypothetical protein AAB395_03540 [Patescibacteria group bacterium]